MNPAEPSEMGRTLCDAGPFIRFGVRHDPDHSKVVEAVERIIVQGGERDFRRYPEVETVVPGR